MRSWMVNSRGAAPVSVTAAATAIAGIGTAGFAQSLLAAVRESAWVSYCSVLTASRRAGARMIDGAGIDGKDVLGAGLEYVNREFYRQDKNGLLTEESTASGRISLQRRGEVMREWRLCCYDPFDIGERCSVVMRTGHDEWIAANFYRRHQDGPFASGEIEWLETFAPVVTSAVRQHLSLEKARTVPRNRLESLCAGLSRREREVISAACQGLTNKEIAQRLAIEVSTVITHRQRAYLKLGVGCYSELVRLLLSPA